MDVSEFENFDRREKLNRLNNTLLVASNDMQPSAESLEKRIHHRVDKEFPEPDAQERDILEGIKEKRLRFAPREVKQQRDNEWFTQVLKNARGKDVHYFHKFSDPNVNMMELLVMGDALRRSGVGSVTLYAPYVPYQRQDKKDDGRVPISAKLMFDLMETSMGHHLKRIVTFDLHAKQAQGHFNGPLDEYSAIPEFAAFYRQELADELAESKVDVISPDAGGSKRANHLAKLLGVQYHVLDKIRTGHGKAETRFYLPASVEGRKVILVDDIIDSGSSVVGEEENNKVGPVQFLKNFGADVYLCAPHPLFSEKNEIAAETRMRNAGAPVLITDSLPEKHAGYYGEHSDWLSVLSLNYVLAKSMYCNQVGESMSTFLSRRETLLKAGDLNLVRSGGTVDITH